jgi:hypothetical protein
MAWSISYYCRGAVFVFIGVERTGPQLPLQSILIPPQHRHHYLPLIPIFSPVTRLLFPSVSFFLLLKQCNESWI